MTRLSIRRERLLRLRTIEHRVAMLDLAGADAQVTNLARIASRLDALRKGLGVATGERAGIELMSIAEMAQRLDNAQKSMTAPMEEAKARRAEFQANRIAAQRREDGAAKLHIKAASEEVVSQERRTDANRQFRKRGAILGNVK